MNGTDYSKTQDYLGEIEDPLARGQGGYNPDELSQIRLTPEQQQQMITGAGISAGTGTAASVGAAQRAANAAGGNPLALAAYRARAARQQGGLAGDAMTQARIGASNTAAQRAEGIGGARIGQQNQGLNYYGGLQAQENANDQAQKNRPGIFDKVMGGISGALSFLDEGGTGKPAVIGEGGPEKVVDLQPAKYMDDGGFDVTPSGGFDLYPEQANAETAPPFNPQPSWISRLRQGLGQPQQQQGQSQGGNRPWSPVDTYKGLGQGAGKLASLFLDEGGSGGDDDHAPWYGGLVDYLGKSALHTILPSATLLNEGGTAKQGANGVFTKPTEVRLNRNEGVVPLDYRARAKMRPSMAALPAARHSYGAR